MEALTDPKYGITGIVVFLALHLIVSVGKMAVKFFEKKSVNQDQKITKIDLTLVQLDAAIRELKVQISLLETELREVGKFKSDSMKLFSAVKIMAGKKWPDVRKAMEEDALPK